jgi:hypothetical protein
VRTPSATWLCSASAALLLALAGCGGKSEAEKQQCIDEAEQQAAADVAQRAYNDGRLGGPEQFAHFFGSATAPLDDDGKLKPYDDFDGEARLDYDQWIASPAVRAKIADDMLAAREAAREDNDC